MNIGLFIHHGFFGIHHLHRTVTDNGIDGNFLVLSFFYGIMFYLFRTRIVWSKWIFLVAIPPILFLASLPLAFWGDCLIPLPVAYMTVYLGLLEPRRSKIISSGDYSYGVYLYGFPVQQAMVAILGTIGMHWYVNFPASLTIAALLSIVSWHAVEKHAAAFRPLLFKGEKIILVWWAILKARLKPAQTQPDLGDSVLESAKRSEA